MITSVGRGFVQTFAYLGIAVLALAQTAFGAPEPASAPSASTPGPAAVLSQPYRVSPGDVLSVATLGEERFTQDCPVNGTGSISFPVVRNSVTKPQYERICGSSFAW